jgi:hypothetical protein
MILQYPYTAGQVIVARSRGRAHTSAQRILAEVDQMLYGHRLRQSLLAGSERRKTIAHDAATLQNAYEARKCKQGTRTLQTLSYDIRMVSGLLAPQSCSVHRGQSESPATPVPRFDVVPAREAPFCIVKGALRHGRTGVAIDYDRAYWLGLNGARR